MSTVFIKGMFIGALCALTGASSMAQSRHDHSPPAAASAPLITSTAKPFAVLMDEAMAAMHQGMQRAPSTGDPGHDFVTMMIPHHQGAIDMAKAVLLYSNDPELRNLAQGILTEQQNEIRLMQLWLQRHASTAKPNPQK